MKTEIQFISRELIFFIIVGTLLFYSTKLSKIQSKFTVLKKVHKLLFFEDVFSVSVLLLITLFQIKLTVALIMHTLTNNILYQLLTIFQIMLFLSLVYQLFILTTLFLSDAGIVKNNTLINNKNIKKLNKNYIKNQQIMQLLSNDCEKCANDEHFCYHVTNNKCNCCIYKFDHSCGFIGNEIGFFNRSYFLKFLFALNVSQFTMFFVLIKSIINFSFQQKESSVQKFIGLNFVRNQMLYSVMVQLLLSFLIFFVAIITLFNQLLLVSSGKTIELKSQTESFLHLVRKRYVLCVENQNNSKIYYIIQKKDEQQDDNKNMVIYNFKNAKKLIRNIKCYPTGFKGLKQILKDQEFHNRFKI